ncbi:hypothetical protein K474DRAFT_1667480 [Panus rudis PR-1116 ss-1]|nr:hypothetical protein K474DRAFT_1667480 [Panus rudis PR-1116 ss-1]
MSTAISASQAIGGLAIELLVTFVLYGVTIAQAYIYALDCVNDPMYLKAVVVILALLETMHVITVMEILYHYTIASFGDFTQIFTITWTVGISLLTEILVVFIVQGFYIRRLWILSGHAKYLTTIAGTLLLVRIAFVLVMAARILHEGSLDAEFPTTIVMGFILGSSILGDAVIALGIVYYLFKSKSDTGIKQTDHILRRLLAYTISSGAITILVSIGLLFAFIFAQNNLLYPGLVTIAGKILYSNSLLASLNARQRIRTVPQSSDHVTMELSTLDLRARVPSPAMHITRVTLDVASLAGNEKGSPNSPRRKSICVS